MDIYEGEKRRLSNGQKISKEAYTQIYQYVSDATTQHLTRAETTDKICIFLLELLNDTIPF